MVPQPSAGSSLFDSSDEDTAGRPSRLPIAIHDGSHQKENVHIYSRNNLVLDTTVTTANTTDTVDRQLSSKRPRIDSTKVLDSSLESNNATNANTHDDTTPLKRRRCPYDTPNSSVTVTTVTTVDSQMSDISSTSASLQPRFEAMTVNGKSPTQRGVPRHRLIVGNHPPRNNHTAVAVGGNLQVLGQPSPSERDDGQFLSNEDEEEDSDNLEEHCRNDQKREAVAAAVAACASKRIMEPYKGSDVSDDGEEEKKWISAPAAKTNATSLSHALALLRKRKMTATVAQEEQSEEQPSKTSMKAIKKQAKRASKQPTTTQTSRGGKRRSHRSLFQDVTINGDGFLSTRGLSKDPEKLLSLDTMALIDDLHHWCHEQRTRGFNNKRDNKIVMSRGTCEEKVIAWRIAALQEHGITITLKNANGHETSQNPPNKAPVNKPPRKIVSNEGPPEEKECMPLIPTLSKRYMDPKTGMPVYKFAVKKKDTADTIYEFRVDTGPSGIRNAGNGAFLTFLGARKLKKEYRMQQAAKKHKPFLQARDIFGRHINVKLKGEGLVEECDEDALKTSLPPLYHYDDNPHLEDNRGVPSLFGRMLDDYEDLAKATFSSSDPGCSWIDLGRYAPLLPTDRKYQSSFDIKNFVWGGMPSEYGFDINEDLDGRECVGDITDDYTGLPHSVAQQNIAMHVNETGGISALKQTVWSQEASFRGVHYCFHTHFAGRLKKGQQVEMFICYSDTYTDIRERKGYGKKTKTVKSDDHFASYLERQHVDRFNMVEEVFNEIQNVTEMYSLTELMVDIHDKVAARLSSFTRDLCKGNRLVHVPDARQIVALRRLDWLKPFLTQKIDFMQKHMTTVPSFGFPAALNQCKDNADKMAWSSWPVLIQALESNQNLVDRDRRSFLAILRKEATEEICFELSSSLLFPCSEDTWCGVARELTQDLCLAVVKERWKCEEAGNRSNLLAEFVSLASKAAAAICSPENIHQLTFSRDCWKRYSFHGTGMLKDHPQEACCIFTHSAFSFVDGKDHIPEAVVVNECTSKEVVTRRLHKDWYLCRQVLCVVDPFAKKYLDAAISKDALSIICRSCHIPMSVLSRYLVDKLQPENQVDSSHVFYGIDFESTYKFGNRLQSTSNPLMASPHKQ
jgi:hypothetical protein